MPPSLAELAANFNTTPERLESAVTALARRAPHSVYYVFRVPRREPGVTSTLPKTRAVIAFPTADDAFAWAQRNGQSAHARLRSITPVALLTHMLADTSINAIRFLHIGADVRPAGAATEIRRDEVMQVIEQTRTPEHEEHHRLSGTIDAVREAIALNADQYDALQFGVDFTARAKFRVALAEAIEDVVATYEPPPGSVDTGARSIYAATAVESWLRSNGFPHARQRRWIDIADDDRWTGGVELCEIDAGTRNHLLIQLVISVEESGRQYIRDVRVTA